VVPMPTPWEKEQEAARSKNCKMNNLFFIKNRFWLINELSIYPVVTNCFDT